MPSSKALDRAGGPSAPRAASFAPQRAERPAARPDRRRSDTRLRILEAAAGLFAEQGYMGTSIASIEAAVGLRAGSGGFYRHFPSKEALLSAIVEGYRERLAMVRSTLAIEWASDPRAGTGCRLPDPADDLRRVLAALVKFLEGEEAMLHIGADLSGLPASARTAIGDAWDESYGIFADLFSAYGCDADRARVLGVSALGGLAHYFVHLRNWARPPLGVGIDPFLATWTSQWSAALAEVSSS